MSFHVFLTGLRKYVSSFFFLLTLAFLSFLIWFIPSPYLWVPASLFMICTFLPLLSFDGRAYIPLIFFLAVSDRVPIGIDRIPPYLFAVGGCIFLSLVLFLILRRLRLRKGELAIPLFLLFFVFLLSYLINAVRLQKAEGTGLFFLVFFFVFLLIYVFFNTVLTREDTNLYFARNVVVLSVLISLQVFLDFAFNERSIGDPNFNLGWSYTSQTASTLLALSLPFFTMLIARKKYLAIPFELFVVSAIVVLSVDSSLLILVVFLLPLLLLGFRSYGKAFPYLAISFIAAFGVLFVFLMVFVPEFQSRVLLAFSSLDLAHTRPADRRELFESAVEGFLRYPAFGASISSMVSADGVVLLSSNTVLSTLSMGGSFGLAAFAGYEFWLYFTSIRKASDARWLFLLFLLEVEFIGLIDNTIYNLLVFLFLLLAYSCYQISDRQDDVLIHDSFSRFSPEERRKGLLDSKSW